MNKYIEQWLLKGHDVQILKSSLHMDGKYCNDNVAHRSYAYFIL